MVEEEVEELTDAEKRTKEFEDLKTANDKVEEELLRREQLKAKVAQGGDSDAGEEPEEISPEDKKKAGAKEFFKGTQLEEAIEKYE